MDQTVPSAAEKPARPTASAASAPEGSRRPRRGKEFLLRAGLSLAVGVVFLTVAVLAFNALASMKMAPPREDPAPRVLRVQTFLVEGAELQRFVAGFGTARADRETLVAAEVAGRITEADDLKVGRRVQGKRITSDAEGKSVRHDGDILVQIDPQTYEERVEQAHALLQQDESALKLQDEQHQTNLELLEQQKRRLETIQREYDRREQLLAQGAGAETELERARLELEQYRETQIRLMNAVRLHPIQRQEILSRTNSHRSELKLAEMELEKATVEAPFDGQVSEVFVDVGQYVRPGEPIARLTDVDRLEVAVPLPLHEAALIEQRLRQGDEVPVELVAREEDFADPDVRHWTGRALRLAPVADEATRTLAVYVEVNNAEQAVPLRPGAFVYARIAAERLSPAQGVLIPRDAILEGAVYLAAPVAGESGTDGIRLQAQRREIRVSDTYQTFALVAEGIEDGDEVVMTNLDIIEEGVLLDIRRQATLQQEMQRTRIPYLRVLNSSSSAASSTEGGGR